MSLWSRFLNAFRRDRLDSTLDEEFRLHIEEAMRNGLSEEEARRQLGNLLRVRERSHDAKVIGWLEALIAEVKFGLRRGRRRWPRALPREYLF